MRAYGCYIYVLLIKTGRGFTNKGMTYLNGAGHKNGILDKKGCNSRWSICYGWICWIRSY